MPLGLGNKACKLKKRNLHLFHLRKLGIPIDTKKMFSNTEDLLPVISFNTKGSAEDQSKHESFVARMVDKGYTERQVRLLAEWYLRVRKAS